MSEDGVLARSQQLGARSALLLLCPAMDYLWTPWRYAYVAGIDKTSGCVFCDLPKAGDDAKARIVHRGRHCYVVLNTYPYTCGPRDDRALRPSG